MVACESQTLIIFDHSFVIISKVTLSNEIKNLQTFADQYLAINFWNQTSINFYVMTKSLSQPMAMIDVTDFAPFEALSVDIFKIMTLTYQGKKLDYLFIGLTNGYLICFNLYESILTH